VTEYEFRFNDPFDTKQVISDTFFPANLLASTEETKPNTTKANIPPEQKILQYKIHIKKPGLVVS